MKPHYLTSLLALPFLFVACTDESVVEQLPPPDEWIVTGNDLGLRNEFIDMANIVHFTEDGLSLYSAATPAMRVDYPVRDSVILGPDNLRWRITAPGQDSLILTDSVQENRYYLQRLHRAEVDTAFADYLSSGSFEFNPGRRFKSDVLFEKRAGRPQGCYLQQQRVKYGSEVLRRDQDDGYWSLDTRFSQPIIAMTRGTYMDIFLLVDSVVQDQGVYGRLINNNVFHQIPQGNLLRKKTRQDTTDRLAMLLPDLDFSAASVTVAGDSMMRERPSFTYNGKLPEGIPILNKEEIADCWLLLDEVGYALNVGERNLKEGKFYVHPQADYLVVDGGCQNLNYLPYSLDSAGVRVTVPITIVLPGLRPRVDFGHETIAYFMTEATFSIPVGAR